MAQFYHAATMLNSLRKISFLALFLISGITFYGQNCSVNAGVLNITICETESLILDGNTPSPIIGTVLWSQISGPAVVITTPNQPSTTVSGYAGGNTYIFRYSATCGDGIFAYQDKVVNVLPITIADAGTDIASCPNSSGSLVINGNAPLNAGETGHWEIIGGNEAGVAIALPNSPTSTISLPATSCGVTTLEWIIEGTEYAPGQRCRTTSQITVTNYGGVTPVTAGSDQTLSNCYTTTQSTTLTGSFGGCGLNGQSGQWQFVSGPNIPTISSPATNATNISNLIEGTYVFRWTVSGPCASGTDLVVVTVPAATQDVTTLPGGTENIFFCDNTITQATLVAQTPLYAGETVLWTQISGGAATIVSPTNPTTLITGISDAGDPYRFRYTLTNSNTGCVFSKDYVIQYNGPTRTIVANNGDNVFGACNQTSFSIPLAVTGTGANTYRIVNGPVASPLGPFPTAFTSVDNSLNITLTAPGTYIIEFVRAETGNLPVGCENGFDTIGVLVSNEPTPSNAGSNQSLACGVTSTLLSGVTASTEGNNYWSQLSGPNSAVIATPQGQNTLVSGLIPGTYEFQYITKGGGITCGFSTDIITIFVSGTTLSTPDAGPDQTICDGSQVQLAANVPDPGEYGEWSQVSGPDTITFSDINDPNATAIGFNTSVSAYVLQWTVGYLSSGTGCMAPVSDSVTISTNGNSGVTIASAGPDTCYPSGTTVISLDGNDTGLLENGIWTVTPAAGVVFTDNTDPDTTATVPGNGTYTFTWTISPIISSCDPTSDSVNVTVAGTSITANAGPDQSACGDTFIMAATGSSGTTGTWTIISGLGGYTISDIHNPAATFTFQNSGFYIFRWTVEADICGVAFDDINITVGIPPDPANAGPNQNICSGSSAVLDGNGYDDFFEGGIWLVLDGAPNVPVFSDSTDPNATISGLTAGTYNLRWVIYAKDVSLCPTTADDMVIQVAPPANAGSDATYCDVTSIQLVAGLNTTGIWSQTSGPASTITQSPSNSYVANATVIPGNSYVFTFTTDDYVFADSTVCPGTSDSVNVQIFSGPSIDPLAGPDQTLCISDVAGTASLDGNTPPGDVTTAEWRFVFQPSGSVASITTPTNPDTTVTNLTVPGLYILEWVFESNSCRTVSDIVRIVMYASPSTADAGPDDSVACQQTYQTNAVPPTVGIGTWSFKNPGDDPSGGSVVIDNPNNPVTTLSNVNTLGTYILTWTVTNGPFTNPSLCQPSSDTVVITFNANPPTQANAGQDQQLCNVTQATMAAIPVIGGIGTWTQASGPTTATIASPNSPSSVMFGLIPGTYEFVWTATTNNNDGCSSNDTMQVTIYALPSTADAGPDQILPQFTAVVMDADTPAVGVGNWTQISGPSTVGFLDVNSPTTAVTGTVSGTYVLQWNVTNGNCTASIDQVTVQILALADLELTKSVFPTTGNAGSVVTFTIDVFNNNTLGGSVDATGVAVRDQIPAGYTLVPGSVSNAGIYNLGDHSITWSNLSVTNGSTISLTFNATINTTGPYVNTAQITASNQYDPDSTPNNNIATEDDQDDATITLQSADLSIQKTVAPASASIGDTIVFTVAVTNSGPNNATDVTVLDQLPAGYTYVSDNSGGAYNNSTGIWTIGTINNGATATIQITVTVNGGSVLNYQNFAEVQTSNQLDPDSTPGNGLAEDDRDDAQITLQQADLELSKNVSPIAAAAGNQVTFTLTVANNGPGNATGVAVQDYIPTGYSLVPGSVSNGGAYNLATSTITWANLSVVNGASQDLTFVVTVNPSGGYINTAQVTASDLLDPDSTPNNDDGDQSEDDEDNAVINFIFPSADLSLTKSVVAGNTSPLVGTQISFELIISNDGSNDATGVEVTDLLPSGYDYVNFSSSAGLYNEVTGIWNVGTVDSGVSESLIIDAIVLPTGDYLNIAEVSASNLPDPDSTPNNDDGDQSEDDEDNATITPVFPSADLSLTKTVNSPTPLIGSQVTFQVVITNSGPQDTSGVIVNDLLPSGYTFNSFTATTGGYNPLTGVWAVGNIAIGEYETLQITATVNATGNYTNVAEVTASSLPDPDSTVNNGVTTEDDYASVATVPTALSADLSLTKTINNSTPLIGSQVTFEVVVTNSGPQDAAGVAVTDLLPDGYTFSGFTVSTGTYNSTTGLWTVGNLANGESETLQLTVVVNATGNYTNTAEVTASSLPDPDSTVNNGVITEDDYATATTVPVGTSADLSLTKTVNNTTPVVGTLVTFSVQVTNNGPQATSGVTIMDLLPAGYTYVSSNPTQGSYVSGTGIWTVGSIANGASETLQLTATVNATGPYINIAEITASSQPDPDSTPGNNSVLEDDYATATTVPVGTSADLSLTKTVNNPTPVVGTQVTFSVQVTNNGPQATSGVTVTDLLPAGYTYASYSATLGSYNPATGLWTVGALASGTSHTLQITATVNPTGPYINSAEVTASSQPDPDSTLGNGVITEDDYATATTVPVGTSADLSLTKTVNNPTPLVGTQVTFSVQVTNNGPQATSGATVTDLLPAGYTYVSYSATLGSYNPATGLWTVGALASGTSHILQITATVNATGPYINIAEITASSQPDPDSTVNNGIITEDDYATAATVPVGTSADLSLTKTVNNPTPVVGTQVTFSVQVTNNGPQATSGVTVTDLLPAGYTYASYSATLGSYNPATGLWTVGALASGTSHILQITATVNATGPYINSAEVTASSQPDPDSTVNNGITTEDDYATAVTVPIVLSADLSLTKTIVGGNATPLVGSQISFEVVVTNGGPQNVTGVTVRDLLPNGYTYTIFSATTGTYNAVTGVWTVGALAVGESETLIVTGIVNASGTYTNIAEITASSLPDPDSTVNNGVVTEDDYSSVTPVPIAISADLSLTKTVNKPTPLVGESLTFTIVVTNNGPQATGGVQVTDLLPSGYMYILASATTGVYSNATGVWSIGTLANGASETLLINAKVLPTGNYANIAEVTASSLPDPDSTPGNGNTIEDDYSTAVPVPIPVSADLSVTKTIVGNNITPLVGSPIIFTVTVSNAGPQPATGVQIKDLLPSGYTFVSYNATEGVYNEVSGVWDIGDAIPSGTSETIQMTVIVNASGNYTNIAEVIASELPDPDSTVNNGVVTEDDYASITTTPIAPVADLSLTKTVVNNNITPLIGTQVIFNLTVSNAGPQPVTGVEVTDLLPTGYSFVSYNATEGVYNEATGVWDIAAPIGAGASSTLQITVVVNASGNYLNTAEITDSNLPDPDSTPANGNTAEDDYASAVTVPVPARADLSITKTVNNATPLVGSGVIFEVVITNNGPQDASGVEVKDLLPSGYNFIVASPTAGVYNSATGLWTLGSLPNGDSETLLINASVLATGNYTNSAEVTASNVLDPDSTPNNGVTTEDDYASVTPVPVATAADVSITKTVNNATPLVGSTVTFEVIVTNAGPQNATGVQITDQLPSGYSFVIATTTQGIYNNGTGKWLVGTIASGTSEILLINATVLPSGNYLNVAEVTASTIPDPDSTPGNGVGTEDDYAGVITNPILPIADLSITKTIVNNNITPLIGTQIIFDVIVSNVGPQAATGVQVRDLLPTGYTFVSYNATEGVYNEATGVWNINTAIASGSSQTLQITATVNASGNYLNTTEIIASNILDPDSTPNNGVTTEDDYASITTTPVTTRADLSLTKTVNNATPLVGSSVTFEVVVTNNGPQDTSGVQVTDLLPSGYTYILASTTAGVYNSGSGVWTVGTLPNGDSETILINAIVLAAGNYLNAAEVTASSQPDPDSTPANGVTTEDDYASAITTPIAITADLSLTKTVNNATPLVGSSVTFEVIVTNNGPQNAVGVQVTDMLPSGYSYVLASTTKGIYNNVTGVWLVGSLANGASETMLINAVVLPSGDYMNVAEISASSPVDPDSTPNNGNPAEDDYATAITTPVPVSADLSLTKTIVGNNTTPLVGTPVIFNVTVSNSGPQTATGVQVTDLLPSGYIFVSYNATEGVYNEVNGLWDIGGDVLSGTSKTLQVTAIVNASGDYNNIAQITASNLPDPDSTPGNNDASEDDQDNAVTVPVIPSADLSITKTVNNLTPFVGSSVTFEVIVTNDGPQSTTGVQITDVLPSGYTYVLGSATAGTYNAITGLWNIGVLSNGTSETLLINAIVNASGIYENIAQVSASNLPDPDSTPGNNVTTEDDQASVTPVPVIQSADLSITKTVNNTIPVVGAQVTFEIIISNDGPQNATGVAVNDLLPSGYTYLFSSATAGAYTPGNGLWNIGTIENGSVEVLVVTATVNASGNYENIAQVSASNVPDPDSTPGNNDASEDDQASATVTPVVESADLSLTKTVNNTTPFEGEQVTFEITVTNSGPQTATGVQVSDLLPSGYTYVLSSVTSGTYSPTTGLWNVETVANGNSQTLLITAVVLASGNHTNITQVTASDLSDPDSTPNNDDGDQSEDDEAAASVQIPGTDIAITKEVDKTDPVMNSQVTFTITADNIGSMTATNIEVTDVLPTGYELVSAAATSGTYDTGSGIWAIPSITAGSLETLAIKVKVIDRDDYLNTARLLSLDQIDTNAANDEDNAEVAPKCLMIYNEFSPNDDGDNDTFYIDCITQYPNNVLEIFNRWGDKVYSRKGYDNSWDGTSDGPEKVLPVGTYFYVLDLGDGSDKESGWLYLKR